MKLRKRFLYLSLTSVATFATAFVSISCQYYLNKKNELVKQLKEFEEVINKLDNKYQELKEEYKWFMTFAKHTESKLPAYKSHFDIYAIYEDWTDKHKSVLKEFKEWYKKPDNALPWLIQKNNLIGKHPKYTGFYYWQALYNLMLDEEAKNKKE